MVGGLYGVGSGDVVSDVGVLRVSCGMWLFWFSF